MVISAKKSFKVSQQYKQKLVIILIEHTRDLDSIYIQYILIIVNCWSIILDLTTNLQKNCFTLAHVCPMFSFNTPENARKPKGSTCFQGVQNENISQELVEKIVILNQINTLKTCK